MSIRNKDFYAEDYSRLERKIESLEAERDELRNKLAQAVSFCEGPVTGFHRIWVDTKLIWDSREDAALEGKNYLSRNAILMRAKAREGDEMSEETECALMNAGAEIERLQNERDQISKTLAETRNDHELCRFTCDSLRGYLRIAETERDELRNKLAQAEFDDDTVMLYRHEIQCEIRDHRQCKERVNQLLKLRDRTCEWKYITDWDVCYYDSECGESWHYVVGGVDENKINYCQGCGGKVVVEAKKEEVSQ